MGASPPAGRFASQFAPWQRRVLEALLLGALDEPPPIEDVAKDCGLSTRQFIRLFNGTYGLAPHEWLMQNRVERAKEMLLKTMLDVSTIARQCGFADGSHMARVFRRWNCVSPGAYRRTQKMIRLRAASRAGEEARPSDA